MGKARRMAERFLGERPCLPTRPIAAEQHRPAASATMRKISNARRHKVHVDASFSFLALNSLGKLVQLCPFSGAKLYWGTGHGLQFNSPSFDRVDPAGFYSAANVQVVA